MFRKLLSGKYNKSYIQKGIAFVFCNYFQKITTNKFYINKRIIYNYNSIINIKNIGAFLRQQAVRYVILVDNIRNIRSI